MPRRPKIPRIAWCFAAVLITPPACSRSERVVEPMAAPGPVHDPGVAHQAGTGDAARGPRAEGHDAVASAPAPVPAPPCAEPDALSPLAAAAFSGDLIAVRKALAAGGDPNQRAGCGPTPLMMAIAAYVGGPGSPQDNEGARRRRKLQIAEHLVAKGADVKLADAHGVTALHRAVSADDAETIVNGLASRLLKAGAPVDPANDHRVTPLMIAVQKNRLGVARLLLSAGANRSAITTFGDTPLSFAESAGQTEMLTLLGSVRVGQSAARGSR